MTKCRTVALIVAAGSGTRAGGSLPKQFATVAGRPMIMHAVTAMTTHPAIDAVVVVVAEGQVDHAKAVLAAGGVTGATVIVGGSTRQASVLRGIAGLSDLDQVLVHDAARPFLADSVITTVVAALADSDAAVPVLPVADTLARGESTLAGRLLGDVVPREAVYRVQTPQGFRIATLRAAHAAWPTDEDASDDAQMVRRVGGSVALVQGDAMLDKVTHPDDFAAAEARAPYESRTATGFDVHRLETGEELWLGGIRIPHDKGLSGHSDADVVLHALTDALLGTIAAGDIGTHFPPSDPQWKGADSSQFLQHAAQLIAAKGGRIDFVDLTILCEMPKIGPHRAAMTNRIADLLDLTTDRVSVKATTTERLGFTGRGEGIAAQAVATISLPSNRGRVGA
ncbi:2-C-methyl-D-erythritol 4-phosphate cytidylyltransferase / 2-C-methyl-D-erythritol 2,4-cyclodiphosphate synthase [Sphingomonas sp. T1]|jgi:2-C-methyl-D-erythritol 4-phosphate cytidylyltransferase/2-C-methyl-D-erythritol 2,4-cyclodiphosphate synthase|uniref:bifunctional 2-C-methyl-D-erythritol 4-phosphate cytidylyltransferase/2-C-methyl-D-erythritol 2,4-cyclodiphosphate synthase n=1 Tax=Sphingomonas sp. T1 TaxID=2653172 RepID=UPI0012EF8F66|nr:bifunctional 2-C-methyl-D-erythritol 4-phosphate cytidylyltransferase/2-C-methyl-D-erythritol 2,4-cyclodiphosphate synthase [Sphingomonas sp. T1]VXC41723.1 2-C-methyl-D-erythritol 4-phosphate cytidylyltransferase / 2-C-methyl-D-erythritol 2,4-cyclodiphosphate synthase [Sphingomonas sp. T1]